MQVSLAQHDVFTCFENHTIALEAAMEDLDTFVGVLKKKTGFFDRLSGLTTLSFSRNPTTFMQTLKILNKLHKSNA